MILQLLSIIAYSIENTLTMNTNFINRYILAFILVLLQYNLVGQSILWTKKANPSFLSINGIAFSNNSNKVLAGTDCHPAKIRIFETSSSDLIWDYTVGTNYMCIMGVSFSSSNNYFAAIEEFGNIFIFDNSGTSPVIVDTINTGASYGFSIDFSPTSNIVAVGCSDGKLLLYNYLTGALIKDINAHPSWVTCVKFSPDGSQIATGGSDNKVKTWTTTGTLINTYSGHTSYVTSVKFTPDNKYIASASRDRKIKIWDAVTNTNIRTLLGHKQEVNQIDISPDGSKVVSASSDSTCKIWDFKTGNLLSTFGVKDSGEYHSVSWSPSGKLIATGNVLSDLMLWDIPNNLGINGQSYSLEISIQPNPATARFVTIKGVEKQDLVMINLLDINGKLLRKFDSNNTELDLTGLNSGYYILQLSVEDKGMYYKKICLQ